MSKERKRVMIKKPENYEEAVAYIEEIPKFTKKHTLDHTGDFLRRLGNPASDRKIIHVAGTNGKGSVCAFIQAILAAEGKKTAFFTSPHLVKINERIQVGREPVSDEEFYRVFEEVFETVDKMGEAGTPHPSYFEFLFGMGMKAFSYTDAEYIVLETGLGGRLDATNSFEHPALTIITSVSLDHTDILGDTIEQIAGEKAGIIKPGVPVFFDGSNCQAAAVIRKRAQMLCAPCREITKNAFEIQEVNRKYIAFSRTSAYDKDISWRVPICAVYQAMNAELAIQASEYLLEGEELHKDRWTEAVASVRWQGRMEEAGEHFIIDGAHNPGAVEAFAESVQALDEEKIPPVIIFSAVADKKYEQMIQILCEKIPAKAYIVTEVEDRRRVPAEELERIFLRCTKREVVVRKEIEEAVRTAYGMSEEGGYIYCLGSLYLAGMAEKLMAGGDMHAEL